MVDDGPPPADHPSSLQRLLDAVISVGSELSLPVVLERIVEAATQLVDARYGALGVLDEDRRTLAEFITVGLSPDVEASIGELPKGRGILGLLIVDPAPIRLTNLADHPDSYGMPPGHPPMTSFLGVPIRIRGEVFGNLYLTDKRTAAEFSEADEELAVALASVAAMAVENARLHARLADMALVEDRERIARDLHDTVIQRLFATGLVLQGLSGRVHDATVAERLQQSVDELDDTVRHIRSTIFELQRPDPGDNSVRRAILDLVDEATETLGFRATTRFSGPVDTLVDAATSDQLLAVVREALSNVARHARASRAEIDLTTGDGLLTLVILDDGRGIAGPRATDGHGLANMEQRAAALGGTFTLTSGLDDGCRLQWQIPLSPASGRSAR
ncbi:MAG: GAF domain-containing sensor histidine kinase [Acidimicrobiia bacterium]|nr:GAF domain-containing sensor histidine kinase [Acidimicrobiia bacterium]